MNNSALLRSLLIYAICLPLAVFLGYQLTDPLSYSTFGVIGIVALILVFPILMRWHHFLLIASWNAVVVLFFIKGSPPVWLVMTAVSLGVAVLQRAMNRHMQFISISQVTWPLIAFTVVVLVTAQLTGGIGLRQLGGEVYGGRRYVFLFGAVLGYFALTSQQIPHKRAGLYLGLFFLLGITAIIGDFFIVASPSLQFIFWLFPPGSGQEGYIALGETRLNGAVAVAMGAFSYMLCKYGIRGIFSINRPWRFIFFVLSVAVGFLSGFRSLVILLAMIFLAQFYLEGLHKSRWMLVMLFSGLLVGAVTVAVAPKLPYTFQRALSFLPIDLDAAARQDAFESYEWRKRIWRAVIPEIPEHLLLGKGYALSAQDFIRIRTTSQGGEFSMAENWDSAIVGDYHNGPLSVVLTFGIWGVITFLWFLVVALRVMHSNYRYSTPELRLYNTFLFATFAMKVLFFFVFYGALHSDMVQFTALLGISVSLNGGVCKPVVATVPTVTELSGRPAIGHRTRPVFQS